MHVPGRITPLGEIAAIADFHDALSADRPWRKRLPPDEVWRTIHAAAGSHLNREIVERFLAMLPPYPLGTMITMTSGARAGATGVVAHVDRERMDRPVVRLLHGADGERLSSPVELDLRRDDASIKGVIAVSDGDDAAAPATLPPVAAASR
jgi:hypothetical protein